MLSLQIFTGILPFLSFTVRAFPLLSQRDVIAPPIILPDASSVWPIGTLQLVIWNTSGIPPPSQVTNPIAQIILGYNESNSLNLDFDNPLAQGFRLTDGNVTVTVPDVPPRDDYLIVLFGDSGDSSPAFAITSIAPALASSSGSSSNSSTVPSTSLSFTTYVVPSASAAGSSAGADATTASPLTGTTTGSTSPSSSSNSESGVTSALAASSSSTTSSGWSLHRGSSMWSSTAPFLMSVAPLVMAFMI